MIGPTRKLHTPCLFTPIFLQGATIGILRLQGGFTMNNLLDLSGKIDLVSLALFEAFSEAAGSLEVSFFVFRRRRASYTALRLRGHMPPVSR